MYSTCLSCHAPLGANESVEHLPIGRRLAFDGKRGRLWVICRRCDRWNLTPFDTRWEALEECERHFRATKLRLSTDHIGLARLKEGLELVRIGEPLRPEMAAWRYGDQFGRRRRKAWRTFAGMLAVSGAAQFTTTLALGLALGPTTIVSSLVGGFLGGQLGGKYMERRLTRRLLVLPDEYGNAIHVTPVQVAHTKLLAADNAGGWRLEVPRDHKPLIRFRSRDPGWLPIEGEPAIGFLRAALPAVNELGARRSVEQDAVRVLEEHPEIETALRHFSRQHRPKPSIFQRLDRWSRVPPDSLAMQEPAVNLALEMAVHEDFERRSLEGELALLERAWKEAEEIAAISDRLTLPEGVVEQLTELKHRHPDP
ncbi:MAG: hypothetical protein HOP28_07640 [Gemmatimonadales bacterium]|nr:hypothetical protein [Gemmatimonadales bacterium]